MRYPIAFILFIVTFLFEFAQANDKWPDTLEKLRATVQSRIRFNESLLRESQQDGAVTEVRNLFGLKESAGAEGDVLGRLVDFMEVAMHLNPGGNLDMQAQGFQNTAIWRRAVTSDLGLLKEVKKLLTKMGSDDTKHPKLDINTQKNTDLFYFAILCLAYKPREGVDDEGHLKELLEHYFFAEMAESIQPFVTVSLGGSLKSAINPISDARFKMHLEWVDPTIDAEKQYKLVDRIKTIAAERKGLAVSERDALDEARQSLDTLKSRAQALKKSYMDGLTIFERIKAEDTAGGYYSRKILGQLVEGIDIGNRVKEVVLPRLAKCLEFEAEVRVMIQKIVENLAVCEQRLAKLNEGVLLSTAPPRHKREKEKGAAKPAESQSLAAPQTDEASADAMLSVRRVLDLTGLMPASVPQSQGPLELAISHSSALEEPRPQLQESSATAEEAQEPSAAKVHELPEWMARLAGQNIVKFEKMLRDFNRQFNDCGLQQRELARGKAMELSFRSPLNQKLIKIFFHVPHAGHLEQARPAWRYNFIDALHEAGYAI